MDTSKSTRKTPKMQGNIKEDYITHNKDKKCKRQSVKQDSDALDMSISSEHLENQKKYLSDVLFTEEELVNLMDKVFQKRLDTIKMMVESCVNKRIREFSRKKVHDSDKPKKVLPLENEASVSTQKIQYSNFGKENYMYINLTALCDILRSLSDLHAVLQKVVKDLYFNQNHRENNIIFIHPKAYKTITVFSDDMWRNFDLHVTLESIIRRANDVLQHYIISSHNDEEILKSEIGKKKFDALRVFTDKIDNMEDLTEFRNRLLAETEHTIVTNQHLVHPQIYEPEHSIYDK